MLPDLVAFYFLTGPSSPSPLFALGRGSRVIIQPVLISPSPSQTLPYELITRSWSLINNEEPAVSSQVQWHSSTPAQDSHTEWGQGTLSHSPWQPRSLLPCPRAAGRSQPWSPTDLASDCDGVWPGTAPRAGNHSDAGTGQWCVHEAGSASPCSTPVHLGVANKCLAPCRASGGSRGASSCQMCRGGAAPPPRLAFCSLAAALKMGHLIQSLWRKGEGESLVTSALAKQTVPGHSQARQRDCPHGNL